MCEDKVKKKKRKSHEDDVTKLLLTVKEKEMNVKCK